MFNGHDVRYLIVRAYALGVHGGSGDLDVWIGTTQRDADGARTRGIRHYLPGFVCTVAATDARAGTGLRLIGRRMLDAVDNGECDWALVFSILSPS